MSSRHFQNFLHKTWPQRLKTLQFHVRRNLAKIPSIPVPVRLKVSGSHEISFWWSQVVPYFDSRRGFFDYWGQDTGDLRFLWNVLEPGMVFLDVGAYHGIYSVVAGMKLKGSAGRVFAFEPSPREFARLATHLRWNHLAGARAESLALGSATSRGTFFQVQTGDTTRNGLRPPDSSDAVAEIPVDTIRLDDFISREKIERVDVIKLDVEGGEVEVIRGAQKVFSDFRPLLISEVLDATTHAWGYDAIEIIEEVARFDYDWFDLQDDGSLQPHLRRQAYPEVKNYVAVPRERREQILERSST